MNGSLISRLLFHSNPGPVLATNECPVTFFDDRDANEPYDSVNNPSGTGEEIADDLGIDYIHTYELQNDVNVDLTGWSHTRNYHRGYLRNGADEQYGTSNPTAIVRNLNPNTYYEYHLYQIAETSGGTNGLIVNDDPEMDTETTTNRDPEPSDASATAIVMSDENGVITFTFIRRAWHVAISALSMCEMVPRYEECTITEECSAPCGGGTRQCARTCLYGTVGDTDCETENEFKSEDCNVQECPATGTVKLTMNTLWKYLF